MLRSIPILALASWFALPCEAQLLVTDVYNLAASPYLSVELKNKVRAAQEQYIGNGPCTYSFWDELVTPHGNIPIFVMGNLCTGKVSIYEWLFADSPTTDARFAPKITSAPNASGAGSQGVTSVPLANGSYVIAWVTGSTLTTGAFNASNPTGITTIPAGTQYSVGTTPEHVISADFNGDGIPDLAVSNFGDIDTNTGGNITILLGNGDGTFHAGATVNAGPTPVAMYSADFNGDGKQDIAAANLTSGSISVLLGNGNGTFAPPVAYPVAGDPQSIVAADWNGDGRIDLAVAGAGGTIDILRGNGDGSFQTAVGYPGGGLSATYLAFMDVNGDGKLDLIVANQADNAFSFLFGNGDGTFQAPVQYVTGAQPQYLAIGAEGSGQAVLSTVDGVSGNVEGISLLTGGLAATPQLHAVPPPATGIAAADLNGDGYPDMIAAAGGISVLLRQPGGDFTGAVNYALQSGSQAVAVAAADLNGDGKPDVVAESASGQYAGTIDIALGSGNGTLGAQSSYAIGGSPGGLYGPQGGVVISDFNGDGKPDVAAGYQSDLTGVGGISVLLNQGGGTLAPVKNYSLGTLSVYCTVTGDFNGDGKPDLAACGGAANFNFSTPGAVGILLGKGDGTFQTATLMQVGSPAGFPEAMVVGDVNGDGKLDLVVSVLASNGNDAVIALLGNGDGTFRQLAPISTPAQGEALALLDLNGDGIPDLVVGDTSESVYLLGNGNGTFQSSIYFNSGAHVTGFAVTQWNNDGVNGLAIAQRNTVMAMVSALSPKLYGSPPSLSVASAHTGNFTPGQQGATYAITVSNAPGAAPVAGVVTVTDIVPSGMTLVSMTGNNWTCSANTCTRSDALSGGGNYDPITLKVNVSENAGSPQVNLANVSGGGSAPASASDSTIIGAGTTSGEPTITSGGVVSASAFGAFHSVAPGSWIEIYGSNLSSDTRSWAGADFQGSNAPTSLDGTSVSIGGQAAFVDYISPGQVNAQVPSNVALGMQPVIVKSPSGLSPSANINVVAAAPGLLAPASFSIGGKQYTAALFSDGITYVLPPGTIANLPSREAQPGDTIILYGVGFGSVTPAIPAGQIVSQSNQLASGFTISVGGVPAQVMYAGLAPGFVGLYQFNIVVPALPANNLTPVTFTLGGIAGTQTLFIAVQ